MSKRALLAIAYQAQEALLRAALESQGVSVTTVPLAAHLETEVMRAMHSAAEPLLVVLDLAVLAQLATPVSAFCAWKNAHCAPARLMLCCSDLLSVRAAEQAWARRHGALGLLCGCSGQHWRESAAPLLRTLLEALDIAKLDEARLKQAVQSVPKPYREGGAIARAWAKLTALRKRGIRPDELIAGMRAPGGPAVKDRLYHMKTYQECFVGAEAVDWIARETGLPREPAVEAGQALLDLGHVYHVAREQPFLDGFYFYRFAADSARLAAIDLNDLLTRLRSPGGVPIRDRTFHAIRFPACFVGAEAVAWLTRECGLTHNEAMTLGQRLIDLFVFHHVVDEHPFKDGDFFYRFYEDERSGG